MSDQKKTPIPCVGIVCFKGDDVLLIQRGKPPRQGEWSIPGGRIEPDESEIDACHRELFEETGLSGEIVGKLAVIHAEYDGTAYELHDYLMIWKRGEAVAGDDAADARFVSRSQLASIPIWDETRKIIELARDKH